MCLLKKIQIFVILAVTLVGVERLCHKATDGFAVVNLTAPMGDYSRWNIDLSNEKKNKIISLLDQKFHYFDVGSQCYVFLGKDQKTILKFFKFQHMRTPPFLDYIPLPKAMANQLLQKKEKKNRILSKTFDSIHIAYNLMQKEAGLIYTQLGNHKPIQKKVSIVDKIGISHEIDLNITEFILQERAVIAYKYIADLIDRGNKDLVEDAIYQLLMLNIQRCKKGIGDIDPDFATNFAFINGKAALIDTGRLYLDNSRKDPREYRNELIRITRDFKNWFFENHPKYESCFDKAFMQMEKESTQV